MTASQPQMPPFSQTRSLNSKSQLRSLPEQSVHNQSYRKTISIKRTPRAPTHPGYDRKAHDSILKEFSLPESPNGCALQNQTNDIHSTALDADSIIKIVIEAVSKILSTLPQVLPSNAANKIDKIHSIIRNELHDPAMEH